MGQHLSQNHGENKDNGKTKRREAPERVAPSQHEERKYEINELTLKNMENLQGFRRSKAKVNKLAEEHLPRKYMDRYASHAPEGKFLP